MFGVHKTLEYMRNECDPKICYSKEWPTGVQLRRDPVLAVIEGVWACSTRGEFEAMVQMILAVGLETQWDCCCWKTTAAGSPSEQNYSRGSDVMCRYFQCLSCPDYAQRVAKTALKYDVGALLVPGQKNGVDCPTKQGSLIWNWYWNNIILFFATRVPKKRSPRSCTTLHLVGLLF